MPEFSSEGFDLDALASANEDVVLELGGSAVAASEAPEETGKKKTDGNEVKEDPLQKSEFLKKQGNDFFKQKEWQRAHEYYSNAINATPGPTGAELLKAQHEWQEKQNDKIREELRKHPKNEKDGDETKKEKKEREVFEAPPHPHAQQLAVYYSNRAAASMQLAQQDGGGVDSVAPPPPPVSAFDTSEEARPPSNPHLEQAVQDCSIALLIQPAYVKALVRRSTAYERMNNTEDALRDALAAKALDPHNSAVRMAVARLQKLEDERIELLKTETLDKLKDLGNSILGNFGLSMDNFNAQKDPNTGSYSISFNQGN